MTTTIWKFPFVVTDVQHISMPRGASPLAVQTQLDRPHLWAVVDPNAERETVEVLVRGTGHALPDGWRERYNYVGTFQLHGGALVFHVFIGKHS